MFLIYIFIWFFLSIVGGGFDFINIAELQEVIDSNNVQVQQELVAVVNKDVVNLNEVVSELIQEAINPFINNTFDLPNTNTILIDTESIRQAQLLNELNVRNMEGDDVLRCLYNVLKTSVASDNDKLIVDTFKPLYSSETWQSMIYQLDFLDSDFFGNNDSGSEENEV